MVPTRVMWFCSLFLVLLLQYISMSQKCVIGAQRNLYIVLLALFSTLADLL